MTPLRGVRSRDRSSYTTTLGAIHSPAARSRNKRLPLTVRGHPPGAISGSIAFVWETRGPGESECGFAIPRSTARETPDGTQDD